jgi:hypothetical protein
VGWVIAAHDFTGVRVPGGQAEAAGRERSGIVAESDAYFLSPVAKHGHLCYLPNIGTLIYRT